MLLIPQRINTDVDEKALRPDECRSKTNLRSGLVAGSNTLSNENILSTVLIPSAYYETNDVVIGSCEDISNDSIIFTVYNPDKTKNKILRYFPFDADRVELILKHEYLNFQLDQTFSGDIIDGLFYFVNGYFNSFINNDFNPPRKINIEKAKKFTDHLSGAWNFTQITSGSLYGYDNLHTAYVGTDVANFIDTIRVGDNVVCWANEGEAYGYRHKPATGYCQVKYKTSGGGVYVIVTDRPYTDTTAPLSKTGHIMLYESDMYFGIDWQVLDQIKYKPDNIPSASYADDPDAIINNLRNKLFQFIYRFVYDNDEKTVWSDPSVVPTPGGTDIVGGVYQEIEKTNNVINVWFSTGPMEVKTVELAVREGNTGDWKLIYRLYKYDADDNPTITSDIYALYQFYNTEFGEPIDQDDTARPFDYVPQVSFTQELIEKNRILHGDYYEGYDNVSIDVSLSVQTTDAEVGVILNEVSGFTKAGVHGAFVEETGPTTNTYFLAGRVDLASFFYFFPPSSSPKYGHTIIIRINAYPEIYDDRNMFRGTSSYTPAFENKFINAGAVVSITPGMTFQTFMNDIAYQLRYNNSSMRVLAIIKDSTSGFNTFDGYTTFDFYGTDESSEPLTDRQLGFILKVVPTNDFDNDDPIFDRVRVEIIEVSSEDSYKYATYKSGMTKNFGVLYGDLAGRVGTSNDSIESSVYVPFQSEGTSVTLPSSNCIVKQNKIAWQINHRPPEWADKYCWVMAKNVSASYYLQASVADIRSVKSQMGIAVNQYIVSSHDMMPKFNVKAYVWESGDRMRFAYKKDNVGKQWIPIDTLYDFEILGETDPSIGDTVYKKDLSGDFITDGNGNKLIDDTVKYLLISPINTALSDFSADKVVVEIYRPQKKTENLIYYQHGEWLPIIDPHTTDRMHSGDESGISQNQTDVLPAKGLFELGDAYIYMRLMGNYFPVESMSFSDYYNSETISIGTPSMVLRDMMRKRYVANLRWSGKKIQDSLTNELSKFLANDYDVLPEKYNNVSCAKEIGEVLRVLQRNKATSIYIGKGEMKQPIIGDEGVVAISPSVVGSMRTHVEMYGTVFPESVVNSNTYTYFFDIYNSAYVRWATNGLQQIVRKEGDWDYGMGKYFRDKCTALLESGVANVNVYAVYEKEYENLIVTFVDKTTPANNETIVFHEPSNSWTMKLSYIPEYYGTNKKVLVLAKDGRLWKANAGADRNTFFGVPYKSEIEVVGHEDADKIHTFNDIELITNSDNWAAPNTGDVSVNIIGGQMKSRLKKGRFVKREGKMVATFGKDMFTSGAEVATDLVAGRELRGHAVNVRLENDATTEVILTGMNINATLSE